MSRFPLKRVFIQSSQLCSGHVEDFFIPNTEDLLIFYVEPRFGTKGSLIRRYSGGALVEERPLWSTQAAFPYYAAWWWQSFREIARFANRRVPTLVITNHPVVFFGLFLIRFFKPLRLCFWIWDYFPNKTLFVHLFERIKLHYDRCADFSFYLSDPINAMFNGGQTVDLPHRRTVMLGTRPAYTGGVDRKIVPERLRLLFVGLLRPGQGIEDVLRFLAHADGCELVLAGKAVPWYADNLRSLITQLGVASRVSFPDKRVSNNELLGIARDCQIAVALYDTSPDNFTHYADPGKIKTYASLRLPIVMRRISGIALDIDRFRCGEVIDSPDQLPEAVARIRAEYDAYVAGTDRFLNHFNAVTYYDDRFQALASVWSAGADASRPPP